MLAQRVLIRACARPHPARGWQAVVSRNSIYPQATSYGFTSTVWRRKDESKTRTVQHELARKTEAAESVKPETVQVEKAIGPAKQDSLLSEQTVSNKEQRKADWAIIKDMARYLWPKNDFGTRFRVSLSVGLLVGAKVDLPSSIVYKPFVDSLSGPQRTSTILFQEHCRLHERRLCCRRRDGDDSSRRNDLCLYVQDPE